MDEAAASTSANFPLSEADIPNAVKASVTMSDVDARSSPDAAARFMIPSIPRTMSAPFHPAIAIYSIACPASVAENCVDAPICFAFASRIFIDVSVAFAPSSNASPISFAAFTIAGRSSFATVPAMEPTVDI